MIRPAGCAKNKMNRKATINVHAHGEGGNKHRDIRVYLHGEDGGVQDVFHFVSPTGLPKPGRVARWRQVEESHLPPDAMEAGHPFVHEVTEAAELEPIPGSGRAYYLKSGSGRYAMSETGDVHYVKNLDKPVEKAASFFNPLETNPGLQAIAVDRARRMGVIPPNFLVDGFQDPSLEPSLADKALSAVGAAAKTVSLAFLGGLGARAGWGVGQSLFGEPKEAASTPETDPADAPQSEGESPAMYRPEDAGLHRPADAAATPTHAMTESPFGHLPSDPL